MSTADRWDAMLRELTAVPGVRGALLLSADDGLVIAEAAMDDLETADVAALVAALTRRAERTARALAVHAPGALHLVAEQGAVLAVAGAPPLWLVAVADPSAEVGRLRLLLGDLAAGLA